MTPNLIDYQSAMDIRPLNRRVKIGMAIVAVAIVLINAALLAAANEDRSWGAFGIAIMIAPITNGVLLLTCLACAFLVRKGATPGWMSAYVLLCIMLPLLAAIADFMVISAMPLTGC